MAFDYGTKRIGIAVTDPMQIIATGLDTIHPNQIVEYLKKYLQRVYCWRTETNGQYAIAISYSC
jgi:RNase H-fold protein (predicted Holliday junction resolvase)